MMRSFIICTLHQIITEDHSERHEQDKVSSAYERDENVHEISVKLKGRNH